MNTAVESKLSEYDFILVLDASGSMSETDTPTGATRWNFLQETALQFTRDIAQLDADGLGVVVFSGSGIQSYDNVGADKVKEIFANRAPRSSTPLAEALTEAIKLAGKSDKKDFIVVFTDGVPDDESKAAQVITSAANKQATDDALTILFIQIGRDSAASAYLKRLDDDLKGAKFDIVDAKTITEAEAFPTTAALIAAAIDD